MILRRKLAFATVLGMAAMVSACDGCDQQAIDNAQTGGGMPGGLTPKQAREVVAKVGDRTITLGDYAAALERMNRIDRLRYQTKERRRELLDEMIDLELLAQEAKRRGLDDKAEVQEAVRQVLREALVAKAREKLPAAGAIPAEQVKAYYQEHEADFSEPERRRVSVIVMKDRDQAEKVLASAEAGKRNWGELWAEFDLAKNAKEATQKGDLSGDLGLVGAPGDKRGDNGAVPPAVRKAVYDLGKVGDIYGELVEHDGKLYIVRLSGQSKGHTRSLEEADRAIRVALLKERLEQIEKDLDAELRKRFPVSIDDEALKQVKIPDVSSARPFWEQTMPPEGVETDPTAPDAVPSAKP